MCRHFAYLGPPRSLRALLLDPPHGLGRQSWAPRMQHHGTVNADGFGIGWYADEDPAPARYRRALPIWADPSLPDLTRVIRSRAVLAAVRSATPGTAGGEQAAAPFAGHRWLFSHNGLLDGWPDAAAPLAAGDTAPLAAGDTAPLAAAALARTLLSLEAMVDSAFLWAVVLGRLRAGAAMATALTATIAAIEAAGGSGRFNFLLTDGQAIAATACGDTLWYRRAVSPAATAPIMTNSVMTNSATTNSVTVASEPSDDEDGWTEVPDRHVLTATPSAVRIRPLETRIDADDRTEGIMT